MKACIATVFIVLFAATASAQFKQGDLELTMLGTAGSTTEKITYSSKSSPLLDFESDDSHTYGYLSLAPAYYFIDGLAGELELGLRAMEGVRPMQSIIINLAYTHQLPRSSVALFARAGYGMSNSYGIPVFLELYGGRSDEFDISIINLGAGAKFLVGRTAFIRTELNYRIQSMDDETDFSTTERTLSSIALFLGVGIVI